MPKKQTTSKRKYLITLVVAMLVGLQVLFNIVLYMGLKAHEDTRMADILVRAVDGIPRHEAVVDGVSGKIYLPKQKLVLPADNKELGTVVYGAGQFDSDSQDTAVTSTTILNEAKTSFYQVAYRSNPSKVSHNIFDELPNLQSCSRGVQLVFGRPESTDGYTKVSSQKLADGRTMTIYKENSGCRSDEIAELIKYLQRAESI